MQVKVGEHNGETVSMATIIIGQENIGKLPIMVFTHGYAATCSLYFTIFKRLSERFVIICFDHVGMGCSSRPPNHYNKETMTPQESIIFFVDHIEMWRQ